MDIGFYGAAKTVTGSQFLITVNDKNILIDCGLFQGKRDESYEKNRNFDFDPSIVDHLVLTHAHIDHSGNIPNLVRNGFKGKIHATSATTDLCRIMLHDSAFIQEKDTEFVNKIRAKQHKPPFKPLYTQADVEKSLPLFHSHDYDETYTLAKGIRVTFRDAGHILGSAGILFEINENGRQYRIGFSGDIGRPNMPLIHNPNLLRDLDYLVMETTYGNRIHSPFEEVEDKLTDIITSVAQNGGKIIIPAFAVGRTQVMVYILHKLFDNHRIPEIPIFVDSPLGLHATEVFRHHYDMLDRETKRIFLDGHRDPFGFNRLTYVRSVEESKSLNNIDYPHIIISSSGMAEGGRILHHLKNNVSNKKATILFVGYAAEHTLARKLVDKESEVKIFGEKHKVKATIKSLDSFSAHADRHELLHYLNHCPPEKMKKIFLVHGEPDQQVSFKNALRSKGYQNVHIAEPNEVVTI
jgi:metallo-beta-lactamase family protein